MRCFDCGASIELASGARVAFRDSCETCGADLHVCCNCAHHDLASYNECRESSAERVSDRDRANRCEYFRPGQGATGEATHPTPDAKAALDSLFKK